MLDYLDPVDASFLYLEDQSSAMNSGTVLVLEPGEGGFDAGVVAALVAGHLSEVPRYRQRIREVPFGVSGPVWVQDSAFDVGYHVRTAQLPSPGNEGQLAEFAARTLNRPLDRRHPLWQLYVVEGLEDGKVALVAKTHQALVDGRVGIDIVHLLSTAEPRVATQVQESPGEAEPSDWELLREAVAARVATPRAVLESVGGGVRGAMSVATAAASAVGGVATSVVRATADLAPESPLNAKIGDARRLSLVRTDFAQVRAVRDAALASGIRGVTVNDVVLAVVTGAIRAWLLSRGEPVHSRTRLKALVPVGVGDGEVLATTGMADRVISCLVDLPVGEPHVTSRLRRISYDMRRQVGSGRALRADSIAELAGFAPPTLHHLGIRVAAAASKRVFNLVVTNAPGPQQPLYVGDARVVSTFPVIPLASGQALSVGVTSYDGEVFFGLNGDRTVMTDIEQLARFVPEALAELTTEVGA